MAETLGVGDPIVLHHDQRGAGKIALGQGVGDRAVEPDRERCFDGRRRRLGAAGHGEDDAEPADQRARIDDGHATTPW